MSLNIALNNALSGLNAIQTALQVVSGNIANAQTPGYSRETISLVAQVLPTGGGGVATGIVQRASDRLLTNGLDAQTSIASAASTRNDYFTTLQTLFGTVNGGNTINDALTNFETALQTLSTTPDDTVAQSSAVSAGQLLAQNVNRLSAGFQSVRGQADQDLNNAVTAVNAALQTVANDNVAIVRDKAVGQSTATLEDQRDQAVQTVAQYMGIQTFTRQDGSLVVMAPSGTVLADQTAAQLGYTPSANVTAGSTLSPVTLNGADVTSQITTGKIGSLVNIRDTEVPSLTAELNQFTNQLFNAAAVPPPTPPATGPTLNTTNSGLGATNDANHFFAGVDLAGGADNGATLQVNPSLVADPTVLYNGPTGPDPAISQTLANNLTSNVTFTTAGNFTIGTTTTLGNYAAQMIGQNANAAAAATSDSTFQTTLQGQLRTQLSSESGVNVDDELSNLITYQNAYGASARVISTIQSMFNALLQI